MSDVSDTTGEGLRSLALAVRDLAGEVYRLGNATWHPLPPGSHLWLADKGERGVGVVAMSIYTSPWDGTEKCDVMTERGRVSTVNDDVQLVIGPEQP